MQPQPAERQAPTIFLPDLDQPNNAHRYPLSMNMLLAATSGGHTPAARMINLLCHVGTPAFEADGWQDAQAVNVDRQNRAAGLLQEIILEGVPVIAKNTRLQSAWVRAMQTGPEAAPDVETKDASLPEVALPVSEHAISRRVILRKWVGTGVAAVGAAALGAGGAAAVTNHLKLSGPGLSKEQSEERKTNRNYGIAAAVGGAAAVVGGMRFANHQPAPQTSEPVKNEIITEESLAHDLLTQLDRALANEPTLTNCDVRAR